VVRLRVRYHRSADFVTDHDQQLARGGLLVRIEPPAGLSLYDPVALSIELPSGSVIELAGQVVQLLPGVGVAVGLAGAPAPAGLAAAVAAARSAPAGPGTPPEHALLGDDGGDPDAGGGASGDRPAESPANQASYLKVRAASTSEKIQLALHGNRDERALILRDLNRTLPRYLLQNPHLGLDEVTAMAKLPTLTTDVLSAIADRREWAQRPEIAVALVRNPKTPVPVALRLLDHVGPAELRRLAKDQGTRQAIRQAVMRRLVGVKP
jgi:hypothetical protein